MIDLKTIEKKFQTQEKVIEVKAWEGKVKIKKLTIEETNSFLNTRETDGGIAGIIQAVSFCLVEPKIEVSELNTLGESAFKGVEEIFQALNEFSNPKK